MRRVGLFVSLVLILVTLATPPCAQACRGTIHTGYQCEEPPSAIESAEESVRVDSLLQGAFGKLLKQARAVLALQAETAPSRAEALHDGQRLSLPRR